MGAYVKEPQGKRRAGHYYKCETCGDEFYVMPAFIRTHEKNNTKIRYCSMKCYNKTGSNNPFYGKKHSQDSIRKMVENPNRPKFKSGSENPNFLRYGPDSKFVRKPKPQYPSLKTIVIKERDRHSCELCNYSDERALIVHHKDRDTKNNDRDNLMLICSNCHRIIHFENKTGGYQKWDGKNHAKQLVIKPRKPIL